ncbi:hypothetical protein GJ744_009652 [Endocarpon pusillum]|uniref:NACHT domain-containing protein n=1 Tax=Endocarpon pusillum TaxID=364733 RepID=A0A8H7AN15_9EURO|nr:hypothetical protein GJ744_009652 [Endocarpon pusillum]
MPFYVSQIRTCCCLAPLRLGLDPAAPRLSSSTWRKHKENHQGTFDIRSTALCIPTRILVFSGNPDIDPATATIKTEFSASECLNSYRADCDTHGNMSHSELAIALSEFQQILSPDQTAQLASFSNNAPTAEDVVRLTDNMIQANAGRKSRLFAHRVQGLLDSVQQYCSIVDTCAGPNQIAALVWGSIKLVLLVLSNFAEYFDKLSERVAQLSNYCPRLSEYKKLFPASARLQQALSDFYAIVVVFCSKALRVVQEKGIKRFSKSIWKSFKVEFKEIEESLSAAKDEVMEELQLVSEQETQGFRRLLITEVEENRTLRQNQVAEIQENKYFRSQQTLALQQTEARQIQKILKEEERRKIRLLRQIPNYDYTTSLHRAQALRCEGTSHWLLNRSEFRFWIDQIDLKHLWCYGIPGCGKTVLMGYVINHLKTTFSARDDTVVIYYFFDSSNKKSLEMSTFLRCILHQAIRPEFLLPDSQRRLESLFVDWMDQAEPAVSELIKLFIHFYRKFKNAFLLIDGLDEADESDQRNVKSFLKEVQMVDGARILAITHADMDMAKVFSRSRALQIKSEDLKDDIELFVQWQIDKHSQEELSICSPSLLDKIKQALISGAEGMFLWVHLQLNAVLDACDTDGTPDRIPDLFETPPRKVTDLYSLALIKLANEDNNLAEIAKKAFQWIVCSQRPLTISELEEAISIITDQKSWRSPNFKLDPSKLCRLCGNLVKYDEANETVSLAHHTETERTTTGDGGRRTALQAAAEGGHLAVVERLIQEKADVNAAAGDGNGRTALQAAAGGGYLAVIERLIQEKADVNAAAAEGYSGRTALQAAAEGGHLAVVERLIQEKANVNAPAGGFGRTALQAAAEGGHLAVVERLIQEKADVNAAAARYDGRTALQAAAGGGHLAVIERLIQEKADVNAAAGDGNGRTALQAAVEGGHLAIVKRLIQEKADVNAATEGSGTTPLQAAKANGYIIVVEYLRQAGAVE